MNSTKNIGWLEYVNTHTDKLHESSEYLTIKLPSKTDRLARVNADIDHNAVERNGNT